MKTLIGTISTNRKGFGFVADPNDEENDFFIDEKNLNFALNGDTVEIETTIQGDDKQGKVIRIVERDRSTFVGTIEMRDGKAGIIPDDKKIYADFMLSGAEAAKVSAGDKVQFSLGEWTDPLKNPQGIITKVIGKKGENNAEMESIVLEKDSK